MARLDRRRLETAKFPVVTQVPLRYGDLDIQGHVNNAAAAVILQEARGDFWRTTREEEMLGDFRMIVAALNIEYAGEMYFPGTLEVRSGIVELGRTSVVIGQIVRQNGHPTVYAETVLVMTDANGPTPVPQKLRTLYEGFLARQT
jgi:acyl-CoA thioester hydrolase